MSVPAVAPTTSAGSSPALEAPRPIDAELLPPPATTVEPGATIIGLHSLLQSMRDMSTETGEKRAQATHVEAKNEIEKAADEELKKQEEERNRTFWDDIADVFSEIGKWVGAVASTVAAVMTCGAASPLAAVAVTGAVLSVTSTLDSTLGISKALLGEEAAMWLNFGMSIGGAVCSGGAAVSGLLSKAPEAAAATASTVKGGAQIGAGALTVAGGVASGMGAVASTAASQHQAAADMAAANQQAALQRQMRLEKLIEAITEKLTEVATTKNRDTQKAGDMLQQWNDTQLAIVRA